MSDQIRSLNVSDEGAIYVPPSFECNRLAMITLGGSPGAGDSGADNTQTPFGSRAGAYDDGTDDGDWDW